MLHTTDKILPKNFREDFIVELRQEMHEQFWSTLELSKKLGVCERTVKAWLRNERFPNGIYLIKLMYLSAHIRKYVWQISGSGKQYIDIDMMKLIISNLLNKL
ncbi:transcriptional regulator [Aggregatibacter segnis]|jgi:hypothetical protein|uniref:Transcriptional regulator n=1 Tax=Aggregatibacter segnis ATCC 33393 TaxID=888057 RepID=E6KV92_9PAST|nr:hypothetical protein [Aggregatibacter segnis]EFU68657.1 conserved hypothetical protein [Aggregatibacter segnis ATCC 33393]QQB10156.1 transcriptional regulator [Aggregatibacter segnis]SQH64064.1 Uncharacterised protein [Aggregatibacter segnis ATCC 33393]